MCFQGFNLKQWRRKKEILFTEEVRKEIKEWGRKKPLSNESLSFGAGQRGRSVPWGARLPEAETTACGCIAHGIGVLLFMDQALRRPVCAPIHAAAQPGLSPFPPPGGWGQGRMLFKYWICSFLKSSTSLESKRYGWGAGNLRLGVCLGNWKMSCMFCSCC